MARSRNIKPSFFTNDQLAEVTHATRLLFIGLWNLADREGRLEDRPAKIRAQLFPFEQCDVDAMLAALEAHDFIKRYTVGDVRCIQVVNFGKHQSPHFKEAPSSLPAPVLPETSTVQARDVSQASTGQASVSTEASLGHAPEIPVRAALIPDSGFPLPDSGLLIADSGLLIADSPSPQKNTAPAAKNPRTSADEKTESAARTAPAWAAYSNAYQQRYGVAPVRNRTTNALMRSFIERIGAEESAAVAEHFVRSSRGLYVAATHALNLLLRDAEAIRTEWATNRHSTDTQARQADRTAATGNTFGKLIQEARNGTDG